jgi:DNA-binding response OmpR family regulator
MDLNTPQTAILVVDDESSVRSALRISLGARGFEVETANNGEQALALLGANRYDVVLLDITMPGMGGIQACKEIQKLSPRPAVLMFTAHDTTDDRANAFEAGADDYITKPFVLRDLVGRIQAVLREPPGGFVRNWLA